MIGFAGHLRLRAACDGSGRTALAEQAFKAPFHLSKPYWDADNRTLVIQVVNATAGVLEGDRLETEICAGKGAALLVTTPSASRVFTMAKGSAEATQRFAVEPDGWLEVLPEPLIPHRGSSYRQATDVSVAAGGHLFYVDQLVPGRIAHGETWQWSALCLDLSVRHDGVLIARERFAYSGMALRELAEFAGSGPTACFANAVVIGPDQGRTETCLRALNDLQRDGVWIGSSALRRSGCSIKIIAPDPLRLRDTLRDVRGRLAEAFPNLATNVRRL